jgi:hypothetical protein
MLGKSPLFLVLILTEVQSIFITGMAEVPDFVNSWQILYSILAIYGVQ